MHKMVKCLVFEAPISRLHPTAARVPNLLYGGEIVEEMQHLHMGTGIIFLLSTLVSMEAGIAFTRLASLPAPNAMACSCAPASEADAMLLTSQHTDITDIRYGSPRSGWRMYSVLSGVLSGYSGQSWARPALYRCHRWCI